MVRLGIRDCFGCFRCCIPQDQGGDSYLQPLNIFQPKSNTTIEELLEQSSQARENMWKKVGSLEPLVLSHTVNPASTGGPKWPAHRQAFRVIKRVNGNMILASDGLSDPFDDIAEGEGNVNGFGLEFYIETPADELSNNLQEVKKSWQFQLLYTVSQLAAGHGGIRNIIDDMHLLSTEAEGVNDSMPEHCRAVHINKAHRVGALLGLTDDTPADGVPGVPDKIDGMPLTDVRLVSIKLLTLAELKLITDKGADGRKRLSEMFAGADRLVSSLQRQSVI